MITMMIMNDFNSYPVCEHRQYNTGDQVWLMHDDVIPQTYVVALLTHDGITWSEGDDCIHRLEGLAKWLHRIKMFWFSFKKNL